MVGTFRAEDLTGLPSHVSAESTPMMKHVSRASLTLSCLFGLLNCHVQPSVGSVPTPNRPHRFASARASAPRRNAAPMTTKLEDMRRRIARLRTKAPGELSEDAARVDSRLGEMLRAICDRVVVGGLALQT